MEDHVILWFLVDLKFHLLFQFSSSYFTYQPIIHIGNIPSNTSQCSSNKQLGRLPGIATPRFPACSTWRFESCRPYYII